MAYRIDAARITINVYFEFEVRNDITFDVKYPLPEDLRLAIERAWIANSERQAAEMRANPDMRMDPLGLG